MNPLDESSIESVELDGQHGLGEELPPRRRDSGPWLWLLLVAVLVLMLGYFFWWRPRAAGEAAAVETEAPATGGAGAPPPAPASEPVPFELPALGASDSAVRQLLGTLTAHPALATLLVPEGLVQRFVAAVDNIAEGVSPRSHIGFLQPDKGFHTRQEGGGLIATPETFRRYDRWGQLLASLDPSAAAETYAKLAPLFDEAYAELGYPDASFGPRLIEAIDRLLATPEVAADAALVPRVSSYAYVDPRWEELGEVEKHLVRMGPENARVVREKLRAIRAELVRQPAATEATQGAAAAEAADASTTP